ncbi:hypothetical protein MARBORIA2_18260 [Methanobrevibacter arboriphilus]|jgi:predicted transcriptional regulator|uniref:Uncharacterized protein n=1 Tax=Methanobrevibacter arboriphilus TaxID=39441 RepID=A0ACA8R2C5_METAZ|nr:transcriptional regulator FilR1 domain-containing protein [Methanobrevibacter arboriphilus]BBL61721.1 hypothetical protein MarbSA_07610 [Methanobrevibacter arboriphilus]GLI12736.1 hypothetical protein MARBORIA2_18260 [Methanobrevibacter arboriphilus]
MEYNKKSSISNNFNLMNKDDINNENKLKNISSIKNGNDFKLFDLDKDNYKITDIVSNSVNDVKSNEIFINIKHILTSTLRTRLLICLFSGKKDLKSLRNDLGKPSTSILHGIKELDKLNLIKKEKKNYGLSSNGTMLAMNIIKLIQNIYSINNNSHFWDSHCIKDIPYESLKKIHLIQNAKSIRSSENDLAKTSKEYISLVSKSKDIKVLLPIFSSIHLDALLKSLNDGSNLELIASKNILEFIRDNGYGEKFSSFVKDNNMNNNKNNKNNSLKIWELSKEFKLFLSSGNNFLSLGLFSDDGYYDDSIMLLDNTKEGINWGLEVFEYYKEYSKQINILKYFNIKNNI